MTGMAAYRDGRDMRHAPVARVVTRATPQASRIGV
jgi:hypothetical protein